MVLQYAARCPSMRQAVHAAFLKVLMSCMHACLAGEERWQACGWALAAVLLSLGAAMMLVLVSYVHRDLETAMSGKDTGRRLHAAWR